MLRITSYELGFTKKNMKKIIAFVGEIASGKGCAADYLIQKHNAGYFRFSNMLRDIANRLYLENSRDNLIRISELIRQNFGEDTMAKVIAKEVEEEESDLIIVDGVRRIADIEHLKKLEGFNLIEITADEKTRYNRVKDRGEKTDEQNLTFEQFQKDAQRSTEMSIREVAKDATHTITNDGSVEELHQKIDALLEKIN